MKCVNFNEVFITNGFKDNLKKPYNFNDYTFLIQIRDIYNPNDFDVILSDCIDDIMHYFYFHFNDSVIYLLNKHNMKMVQII